LSKADILLSAQKRACTSNAKTILSNSATETSSKAIILRSKALDFSANHFLSKNPLKAYAKHKFQWAEVPHLKINKRESAS